METPFESSIASEQPRALSLRARIVSYVGPVTAAGGIVWAIIQPYRLTILHPRGQGFWWLLVEPQILVVVVGLVFALFVARPLLADLEAARAAPR